MWPISDGSIFRDWKKIQLNMDEWQHYWEFTFIASSITALHCFKRARVNARLANGQWLGCRVIASDSATSVFVGVSCVHDWTTASLICMGGSYKTGCRWNEGIRTKGRMHWQWWKPERLMSCHDKERLTLTVKRGLASVSQRSWTGPLSRI